MVESRRQVEEHQAGREYRAAPKVLGALSLLGSLRHEYGRPDYGSHEPDPVSAGVQNLPSFKTASTTKYHQKNTRVGAFETCPGESETTDATAVNTLCMLAECDKARGSF